MTDTAKALENVGLHDVDSVLEALAVEVGQHALKLKGKQNFSTKLDALKVLTAYKSVKNRAPEGDEGAGIAAMRAELEQGELDPEPTEDPPEGDEEEQEDEEEEPEEKATAPVRPNGFHEWRREDAAQ